MRADDWNCTAPSNCTAQFGGLPQLTNLTAHLAQLTVDIEAILPDPNWAGVANIDWEAWKPGESCLNILRAVHCGRRSQSSRCFRTCFCGQSGSRTHTMSTGSTSIARLPWCSSSTQIGRSSSRLRRQKLISTMPRRSFGTKASCLREKSDLVGNGDGTISQARRTRRWMTACYGCKLPKSSS